MNLHRLPVIFITLIAAAGVLASEPDARARYPLLHSVFGENLNADQMRVLKAEASPGEMADLMSNRQKIAAKVHLKEIEKITKEPQVMLEIAEGYRILGFPDEISRGVGKFQVSQKDSARPKLDVSKIKDPFDRRILENIPDGPLTSRSGQAQINNNSTLPFKPSVAAKYSEMRSVPGPANTSNESQDHDRQFPLLPLAAGGGVLGAVGIAAAAAERKDRGVVSLVKSFAEGVGTGVVGAAVVTGAAVGAAALGVPAIVVTGTLGIVAIAGGVYTIYDTVQSARSGDWNNVAFNVGAVVGGAVVGAAGGGRVIADKVSPSPSAVPRSWSPFADLPWHYTPNYRGGSLAAWLGSGPTPQSGGGSAALGGSGISQWIKSKWFPG